MVIKMMDIEKFCVSNDPELYEAWPDVTLAPNGKLLCVFSECTSHCVRTYTRIMLVESADGGRTWSPKRPITEGTKDLEYYYNCPRISTLPDGRVAMIVDRIPRVGEGSADLTENVVYFSCDNGKTWSAPETLPIKGIVPDKYRLLNNGRIALAAHYSYEGTLTEFICYSDDGGKSWSEPAILAHDSRYHLCEACLIPLGGNNVVALLRENSGMGYDCFKCVSTDNGTTWSAPVNFPLPGCHRPVGGLLRDGRCFITYRFHHGGGCGMGAGAQNFFGALTDCDALMAPDRKSGGVRIIPIDHDRALKADTGYSGWVQMPDDSLYVVNYIVDDAVTLGQIRGYRIQLEEAYRPSPSKRCANCNCTKGFCKRFKE